MTDEDAELNDGLWDKLARLPPPKPGLQDALSPPPDKRDAVFELMRSYLLLIDSHVRGSEAGAATPGIIKMLLRSLQVEAFELLEKPHDVK